jgi:8-oxo-dGTP diphosphatase
MTDSYADLAEVELRRANLELKEAREREAAALDGRPAEAEDSTVDEVIKYTADVVLVTRDGRVLLIEREYDPFAGRWALPGGHVDAGETSLEAAVRELVEETGVVVEADALRLVGVYDAPGRDPRGRYVTVAYRVTVAEPVAAAAGDDASAARWWELAKLPQLAFDHAVIVADAVAE